MLTVIYKVLLPIDFGDFYSDWQGMVVYWSRPQDEIINLRFVDERKNYLVAEFSVNA